VVALPRPRPAIGDTARPVGEIAKPAGDAAKPEPARARPQTIAELAKPAGESAKPEAAPARPRQQVIADIQRELSRRGFFDGATDGVYGPKTDAAIRDFEHAARLKPSAQADEALLRVIMRTPIQAVAATRSEPVPRPPAPIRTGSTAKPQASAGRVIAVQRALADFGYGQLTPNGVVGPETKVAIERFERERKLPVTGQVSDRLTRELAAVTGRPLE
jgi:peptidoglycan hydrolase-like protein with peptidoglycan-binding domain